MQQHTRHFVGKFCHKTLSSKSGILWIYGAFKTTGNSGKKIMNHDDVSDLQVVALERGLSSRFSIQVENRIFPVVASFTRVPSCLELTKVRFCSSEMTVVLSTAHIMLH
jgi:hypothetical protein